MQAKIDATEMHAHMLENQALEMNSWSIVATGHFIYGARVNQNWQTDVVKMTVQGIKP